MAAREVPLLPGSHTTEAARSGSDDLLLFSLLYWRFGLGIELGIILVYTSC